MLAARRRTHEATAPPWGRSPAAVALPATTGRVRRGRARSVRAGAVLRLRTELDGEIFRIAGPALVTLLLDPFMALIDTAVVGRTSAAALAGTGLGAVTFSFLGSLCVFLSVGTVPIAAQAYAESRDVARVGRAIGPSLALGAVLGVVGSATVLAVAPFIAKSMTADPAVYANTLAYLRFRAPGLPFLLVQYGMSGALRGLKDTVTPLRAGAIASAFNLVGDLFLVLVCQMGSAGAAAATSMAQALSCCIMAHLLHQRGILKWESVFRVPTMAQVAPLLSTAASMSSRTLISYSAIILGSQLAQSLGRAALAGHEIVRQLAFFLTIMYYGMSIAAQSLMAGLLAEKRVGEAQAMTRRLIELNVAFSALQVALLFGAREHIVSIFTADAAVAAATLQAWTPLAWGLLVDGVVVVLEGVLFAAGRHREVAGATILASLAATASMGVLCQQAPSLASIWLGMRVISAGRLAGSVLFLSAANSPLRSPSYA